MMTPVQSLAQKHLRIEHIRRIDDMTLEAYADLLHIRDKYKDDIDTTEINDFWISIASIKCRTSKIYVDHMSGKHHDTAEEEDHGKKEARPTAT